MTCDEIERDEIAEQYILGRLQGENAARFEAHYFDCMRCLERVEQLESVRNALTTTGPAKADAPRSRRLWRTTGALAAAAMLVVAIRLSLEPSAPSSTEPPAAASGDIELVPPAPEVDLQTLGTIEPPLFTPPRLRSASEPTRAYLPAMDAYSRGDYTGAIPGLEEAVRADPASPTARFFLAVSYLQLDRRAEAIGHLRGVIQAGESPYLEDALFFLAKAAIRSGDLEAARDELRRVVALDGERREEASRLLQELP